MRVESRRSGAGRARATDVAQLLSRSIADRDQPDGRRSCRRHFLIMALVVSAGTTGSVCERVVVERVIRRHSRLEVSAVHQVLGQGCFCVAVCCGAPFEVIAVPRSDRQVMVEWQRQPGPDCV